MTIHVAIGKSARSNRIVSQQELGFEQLAQLLSETPVHVGQLTLEEYLRLKSGSKADKDQAASDKDTAWFSLASFAKPTRAASNVQTVSAWVGDFDSGNLTKEQITATLGECAYILLTTYSHSAAAPKWRLIVPYSRPVSVDEHARMFDYFASLYGDAVDSSTRDPCRLWYFPSRTADGADPQMVASPGTGMFDPDAVLATPTEDDLDATLPQRVAGDLDHPNDALSLQTTYEKPDTERVRRMLGYIRLEDAPGKRRGPWLKILQAIHDWAEGSDEGFALIDEWSATQPSYAGSDDVRKIWDSCRGSGVTIATVIKLAVDSGYTEAAEEVPDDAAAPAEDDELSEEQRELLSLTAGAFSLRDKIKSDIDTGMKRAQAALANIEPFLIYVADQQEYYSLERHTLLSKDAIRQIYRSQMPPKVKGGKMDPCLLLENSITKKIVSSMGYHPGEGAIYWENGRPLANWHQPYNVEPLQPTAYELELFMGLIRHLFPDPEDKTFSNYLLTLLAYSVQKPGQKVSSAPLLYSRETGTGKTTMLYEIPAALFGKLNCTLVSNDEIESGFSDFLAKKHLLHLDEIFMGGMRQAAAAANKFKPVVTNSTIKVHPKGFAGYDTTNRLIVTACSNYDNAVHLTDYDRRWAVHEVRAGKMDKGFATAFYAFLNSDRGPGVLRHIFLNLPIAGFNPHADAPMTREKREMIDASLGFEESQIREAVRNRTGPFQKDLFPFDEYLVWLEVATGKKVAPRWGRHWARVAMPKTCERYRVIWGNAILRLWPCRDFAKWENATVEDLAEHLGVESVELAGEEEAA